jgi:hypothetical protein
MKKKLTSNAYQRLISRRFYKNRWFVQKHVLTAKFRIPGLEKEIKYSASITVLTPVTTKDQDEIKKWLSGFENMINGSEGLLTPLPYINASIDTSKHIKIIDSYSRNDIVEIAGGKKLLVVINISAYEKGKQLPLYYGTLYFILYKHFIKSEKMRNEWFGFSSGIASVLDILIQNNRIRAESLKEYEQFCSDFSDLYFEYIKEKVLKTEVLQEFKSKLHNNFRSYCIQHYCLKVFNSFIKELKKQRRILECKRKKCQKIFTYKNRKTYCSVECESKERYQRYNKKR